MFTTLKCFALALLVASGPQLYGCQKANTTKAKKNLQRIEEQAQTAFNNNQPQTTDQMKVTDPDERLVGKWIVKKAEGNVYDDDLGDLFEFTSDGRFLRAKSPQGAPVEMPAVWYEGDKVKLEDGWLNRVHEYEFQGETLYFKNEQQEFWLERYED